MCILSQASSRARPQSWPVSNRGLTSNCMFQKGNLSLDGNLHVAVDKVSPVPSKNEDLVYFILKYPALAHVREVHIKDLSW